MPKIRVLSDILASQVAAGEVVERPASVVKELVENSIDAGAREIRVDADQGGAALIRVSDDGCGMSREDALLSLERHATSKLRNSGDLATILTLGFRGEAVPSVASVSRFRMVTRETDAVAGTEIWVDGGKIRDVRDAGCAPGTTIEAKALFYNLPARRKFLKAESTESAHIEHQLRLHALAAPNIRFRLRRDDREVFDLPPAARAIDRVRQLIGHELGRELIPLPTTHGNGISLEGYLLPASHARKGRRHQFVFLNGRPVEDAVISRALAEGFRGALADGLHPAAWIWIGMNPELVDVNVHPAKREVRFRRPLDLREIILAAVNDGLHPALPPLPSTAAPSNHFPTIAPAARPATHALGSHQPPLESWVPPPAPLHAEPTQDEISSPPAEPEEISTPALEGNAFDPPVRSDSSEPSNLTPPKFRIVGMVQQRFVVMESDEGLVLMDPKAARERIFYEFLTRQKRHGVATQGLLVPILLELDPRDLDLLLRARTSLAEAGIEVDDFGGNTLQIRALPALLELEDPRSFIGALLDELLHDPASGARFAFQRCARLLARRAAMATTPRLNEAESLVQQLFQCELPYCTADGRPTLTQFATRELERRFGIQPPPSS